MQQTIYFLVTNVRVLMASLVLRERLVTLDPREMLVPLDPLDLLVLLVLRWVYETCYETWL